MTTTPTTTTSKFRPRSLRLKVSGGIASLGLFAAAGCAPPPTWPATPPTGSCHIALPAYPFADLYYTGTPNVANNLWFTDSADGSCTGAAHFSFPLPPLGTLTIVGLASDLPVGANPGDTANANCVAMGGGHVDNVPLSQTAAGFSSSDYACELIHP